MQESLHDGGQIGSTFPNLPIRRAFLEPAFLPPGSNALPLAVQREQGFAAHTHHTDITHMPVLAHLKHGCILGKEKSPE